jgi:exonuclease III
MRIITWNCNMALGKKARAVLELQPHVLIVQECSEQDMRSLDAHHVSWVGGNRHRGLGVAVFQDLKTSVAPCLDTDLPWFLPISVGDEISILAFWACVKSWKLRYVTLAHKVLDDASEFLSAPLSIATGDFNSNAIWDGKYYDQSHSALVARFSQLGMSSAYHTFTGEAHGSEQTPTQYMYRHRDKPYHLDYAFVSNHALSGAIVQVGSPDVWLRMSDHMPIIVDLNLPTWR